MADKKKCFNAVMIDGVTRACPNDATKEVHLGSDKSSMSLLCDSCVDLVIKDKSLFEITDI